MWGNIDIHRYVDSHPFTVFTDMDAKICYVYNIYRYLQILIHYEMVFV